MPVYLEYDVRPGYAVFSMWTLGISAHNSRDTIDAEVLVNVPLW